MKKVAVCIVAVMLVVVLILAGCVKPAPAPAPAPKEPIRIGAIIPFTGPALEHGPPVEMGVRLALDDYGWEVAGRKIELVVDDSACQTTVSYDKAVKQVERDKVGFIVAPLQSEIHNALGPYVEKNKVFLIGPRTMSPEAAEQYSYVFGPSGSGFHFGYPMGVYAYEELGYKTVTMLHPEMSFTHEMVDAFKKGFEGKGGKVIQEQWHPFMAVDFAPYITAMKEADALLMWNPAPGRLRFLAQYGEMGMFRKMPVQATFIGGTFVEKDLHLFGDSCLGIHGSIDWSWNVDTPANKTFMADYEKKYNRKAESPSFGGYTVIQIILEAIKATGGDTTPEKVKEAMLNLKLDTITGSLAFTPEGMGIFDVYIVENVKVAGVYQQKIVHRYPAVGGQR